MPLTDIADFITSLPPVTGMTSLKELNVMWRAGFELDNQSICSEAIAHIFPFINNISGILESMSITSYGHIDLSSFFRGLGHFPCLTSLSLIIPLNNRHIIDPSALNFFLAHHSGLHHLCIRNRHSDCCLWPPISDHIAAEWFQQCFKALPFPRIKVFTLGLSGPSNSGIQNYVLASMKSVFDTSSSLVLAEPYLSFTDLCVVLASVPTAHFRMLSLCIVILNLEVIDLLAESCPNLDQLVLSIERTSGLDRSWGTEVSVQLKA
jgi:hypothetical protein